MQSASVTLILSFILHLYVVHPKADGIEQNSENVASEQTGVAAQDPKETNTLEEKAFQQYIDTFRRNNFTNSFNYTNLRGESFMPPDNETDYEQMIPPSTIMEHMMKAADEPEKALLLGLDQLDITPFQRPVVYGSGDIQHLEMPQSFLVPFRDKMRPFTLFTFALGNGLFGCFTTLYISTDSSAHLVERSIYSCIVDEIKFTFLMVKPGADGQTECNIRIGLQYSDSDSEETNKTGLNLELCLTVLTKTVKISVGQLNLDAVLSYDSNLMNNDTCEQVVPVERRNTLFVDGTYKLSPCQTKGMQVFGDDFVYLSVNKMNNVSRYVIDDWIHSLKIIVASDPQPFRVDGSCGDPNLDTKCWEREVDSLSKYLKNSHAKKEFAFMMINGDMTEFGRQGQFNDYLVKIQQKIPTYFGLGNHDIENNVNDCTDNKFPYHYNTCAINMLKHLKARIDYAMKTQVGGWYNYYMTVGNPSGKFCYGFDATDFFHFMQFNNHPEYAVNLYRNLDSTVYIDNAISELEKNVRYHQARGKIVILNWHKPTLSKKVENVLKKYDVSRMILFVGHTHSLSRYVNEIGIQVFNSGAMFYGNFIKVNFYGPCMQVIGCYSHADCVNWFYKCW